MLCIDFSKPDWALPEPAELIHHVKNVFRLFSIWYKCVINLVFNFHNIKKFKCLFLTFFINKCIKIRTVF